MIEIFQIVAKDDYILAGQNDPEGRLFLHFNYSGKKFGKAEYKALLEDWAKVLETFAYLGIPAVYSAVPKGKDKVMKWQTLFGLEPIAENEDAVFYSLEV